MREITKSIFPVAGTFIDSSIPNESFCLKDHYFLGVYGLRIVYRILLKFDLSELSLNDVTFKATLSLFCVRNDFLDKKSVVAIHRILSDWDEQSVCFSNQPFFDETQKKRYDVHNCLWEHIYFDVTDFVKQWIDDPSNNHGVMIKLENEQEDSLFGFFSKNHSCSKWRPCLRITFTTHKRKNDKNVAILTPQFFDWNGARCLFGGGERYLIDLAKLIKKLGYKVDVFQPSNKEWKRSYSGIDIYGIGGENYSEDFFIGTNLNFKKKAKGYSYHIYFAMDSTFPYVFPNSICISHGIWWDSDERPHWRSDVWYERLFHGLSLVNVLVSVDTNTINWLNAVNPRLNCRKIYIPNYVDTVKFKFYGTKSSKKYVKILYPRRLHPGRGFSVCKEVAVELVNELDNVVFAFVGRGGTEDIERHMRLFASKNPRIEYSWYDMNEMYKAYTEADIVLIPSLYSEGTSLSLLEAMATGKPVIAGLVGGLTDLVIHGFNGYLIEVNKKNLKNAIITLVNNPELREVMGRRGYEIARDCFSKTIWEERWAEVIREYFA